MDDFINSGQENNEGTNKKVIPMETENSETI